MKHGIPSESVVFNWDRIYRREGSAGLYSEHRGRMKKQLRNPDVKSSSEDIEKELEYLRAENAYLKKLHALVQERIFRESGKKSVSSRN
jgi:transposase